MGIGAAFQNGVDSLSDGLGVTRAGDKAGKDSIEPPAAPDYNSLIDQQTQSNIDTANANAALNRPDEVNPYGSRQYTLREGADPKNPQPGDWISTTTLTPEQQRLLDTTTGVSQSKADLAQSAYGRVEDSLGQALDTSGLPARAGGNVPLSPADYDVMRKQYEDAYYNKATQYADERFTRQGSALDASLLNSGFAAGSEGFDNAKTEFGRQQNDFYGNAANEAILAGGTEASRALADTLAGMGFQNDNRAQALQEEIALRQLPLNEVNALVSGTNAQVPNFGAITPVNVGQTDVLGAANSAYNGQLDAYGIQAGQQNAQAGAAAGLGTAAMLAFAMSDRRLKSRIRRLGRLPSGLGWYSYRIHGRDEEGVMYDEAKVVFPDACKVAEDGYGRVCYAMLG